MGDAGLDVLLDLGPQRATGDGELDGDADVAVGADLDGGHHAEIDDVAAELGVDDTTEQAGDVVDCR